HGQSEGVPRCARSTCAGRSRVRAASVEAWAVRACEHRRSARARTFGTADGGIGAKFACKEHTLWRGATPEARRDFGVILAPEVGSLPATKGFFPRPQCWWCSWSCS